MIGWQRYTPVIPSAVTAKGEFTLRAECALRRRLTYSERIRANLWLGGFAPIGSPVYLPTCKRLKFMAIFVLYPCNYGRVLALTLCLLTFTSPKGKSTIGADVQLSAYSCLHAAASIRSRLSYTRIEPIRVHSNDTQPKTNGIERTNCRKHRHARHGRHGRVLCG